MTVGVQVWTKQTKHEVIYYFKAQDLMVKGCKSHLVFSVSLCKWDKASCFLEKKKYKDKFLIHQLYFLVCSQALIKGWSIPPPHLDNNTELAVLTKKVLKQKNLSFEAKKKNLDMLSSTVVEHAKIEVEHEDGPLTKPWTNKSIQWSLRENRKRGIDVCFWFRHFLSVTHWEHCERFNSHQIPTFLMCRLLFSSFFSRIKV